MSDDTVIPTMQLRFVTRGRAEKDMFTGLMKGPQRVLQQAFTVADTGRTEWRDVPLAVEEGEWAR